MFAVSGFMCWALSVSDSLWEHWIKMQAQSRQARECINGSGRAENAPTFAKLHKNFLPNIRFFGALLKH